MSKKTKDKIAIVKNQTFGGGDRYSTNVISEIKKRSNTVIFSPKSLTTHKSFFRNLYSYLNYVYIYLPEFYKKLGTKLSKKEYKNIIIFQDAYRKCPDIFQTLKSKSIYILHEPPREFYEPINLHAPSLFNKLFTYLIRGPIFFIDRNNTAKANTIVVNSKFSKKRVEKIYKKKSKIIYPGFSRLTVNAYKRKRQCISIGSLLPYKGHDLVIKGVGEILKNKPKLLIVGEGSIKEKKYLESLAKRNSVEISILNHLSDTELGRLLKESKVYINAAYKEPFGMTSLEALGHGCNLVTVDDCGTMELKQFFPKNVYISNRNPINIANLINKALKNKNKINRTPYFSWKRVSEEIINSK